MAILSVISCASVLTVSTSLNIPRLVHPTKSLVSGALIFASVENQTTCILVIIENSSVYPVVSMFISGRRPDAAGYARRSRADCCIF